MKSLGINCVCQESSQKVKTKLVTCWGWRKGQWLRAQGHEVLVFERGYIGDRFKYTSIGWNGLNGYAEFPEINKDGTKRFKEHGGVISPWKRTGDYALILGQVPNDMSLQGKNMEPWYESIAREIKERWNIPVYFRQHPDLNKKGITQTIQGTEKSEGSLSEALSGALFTVCYNSNSSVDSVLSGVPCVVGDKGSMAWDVCSKDINELTFPDREEWAGKLAFKQWDMSEIESGEALKGALCRLGL